MNVKPIDWTRVLSDCNTEVIGAWGADGRGGGIGILLELWVAGLGVCVCERERE